jgi:hypothetical protein
MNLLHLAILAGSAALLALAFYSERRECNDEPFTLSAPSLVVQGRGAEIIRPTATRYRALSS